MRVLLLRRQDRGELASFVDDFGATLPAFGITAVIHDAGWIPEKVNRQIDREISARLREEATDYDLVHAFGYRAAWACAEAFGDREAWLYSAYDAPRTTHPFLVERLNQAQVGIASSAFVRDRLEAAGVLRVETIAPGYLKIDEPRRNAAEVRAYYQLPEEGFLVGASFGLLAANATPEDMGIDALAEAWPSVLTEFPTATLAVLGDGELQGDSIRSLGSIRRGAEFIAACDLWVEAGRDRGASRATLCALAHGVPVLVRDAAGTGELVAPDVSGFVFPADGSLAALLMEALRLDLTREAIGNAGRARFEERYTMKRSSDRQADVYREIAERLG